jgi:hypothetical protein
MAYLSSSAHKANAPEVLPHVDVGADALQHEMLESAAVTTRGSEIASTEMSLCLKLNSSGQTLLKEAQSNWTQTRRMRCDSSGAFC